MSITIEEIGSFTFEKMTQVDWAISYEGKYLHTISTVLKDIIWKQQQEITELKAKNAQLNADSFHHAKRLLKLSDAKKQIKELKDGIPNNPDVMNRDSLIFYMKLAKRILNKH